MYAEALRYYEAAEPFFAAALPPLHPVGGIRALELSKLAAGLGQFDRGLRYGAKAKVVLSITHGADAPVLRTVNGARLSPPSTRELLTRLVMGLDFVDTLKMMVAQTAKVRQLQAAAES